MSTSPVSKRRILFVDDEPEHVQYHIKALRESGYDVKLVKSSDAALDLCLNAYAPSTQDDSLEAYDLIILDMMMPPPKAVQPARVSAGLATGAYILGEHRKHHADVPAMIFSNLSEQECVESICRICAAQLPGIPPGTTHSDLLQFLRTRLGVTICEKRRTPPFMLPTRVGMMMTDPDDHRPLE
ncbi:MAG: response regulator [Phycisphaerae bacterium]|nr:response regulator [Phycisphaerae bacterium]